MRTNEAGVTVIEYVTVVPNPMFGKIYDVRSDLKNGLAQS
jgi:hypothetical protein